MSGRTLDVVVRRRFRASLETVFGAFTEPEQLARWFSPSDEIATEVVEFDLRVGGSYRFVFRFPGGHENSVLGVFREISRPNRLVYTWTWQAPDPHAGIETLVTVELKEEGSETEVTVTHERFPNQEARKRHDAGWRGAFDRLAKQIRGRR